MCQYGVYYGVRKAVLGEGRLGAKNKAGWFVGWHGFGADGTASDFSRVGNL